MTKSIRALIVAIVACAPAFSQEDRFLQEVQFQNLAIDDIGTEHVSLKCEVFVRVAQKATIESLRLSDVTLNGLPVFVDPVVDRMELAAERLERLPGSLRMVVYYRDLDSTTPLEKLMNQSTARVEGRAEIEADLNLIQQIGLLRRKAKGVARFSTETPVSIPGGALTRTLARAALMVGRPLVDTAKTGREVLGLGGSRSPLTTEVQAEKQLMVAVECAYQLEKKNQSPRQFRVKGMGVMVSPTHFVALKQFIRPWEFEPEVLALMRVDGWKLSKQPAVIKAARMVGNQTTSASDAGELRIVNVPAADNEKIVVELNGKRKPAVAHKRVSSKNLVMLEFSRTSEPVANPDFYRGDASKAGRELSVGRVRVEDSLSESRFQSSEANGSLDANHILLSKPLDATYFGAAVFSNGALLALIQDDRHALLLRTALEGLGMSVSHYWLPRDRSLDFRAGL